MTLIRQGTWYACAIAVLIAMGLGQQSVRAQAETDLATSEDVQATAPATSDAHGSDTNDGSQQQGEPEGPPKAPYVPEATGMEVHGGISLGTTSVDVNEPGLFDYSMFLFGTRVQVGGTYPVMDKLDVYAEWGAMTQYMSIHNSAATGDQDASEVTFVPANLWGGVRYRLEHHSGAYWVGGGIALPFVWHDADDTATVMPAAAQAQGMNGGLDAWRWADERFSMVGHGHAEFAPRGAWRFKGQVGLGLMIDVDEEDEVDALVDTGIPVDPTIVDGNQVDSNTEFVFQVRGEAGYQINDTYLAGGRLSLVLGMQDEVGDSSQFAIEPFGRMALSDAMHAEVALMVNLDKPFGFAFSEGHTYGLACRIGTTL